MTQATVACRARVPRVGVLGGTFDPVHVGHLAIAEAARAALRLERVLFVPARFQPHKLDRPVTAAEHRWEMVLLAVREREGLEASRVELDRQGVSYTAGTLRQLASEHGGPVRLYFICGADALLEFHTWHRPDLILAAATLAVAGRPGHGSPEELAALADGLTRKHGGRIVFFPAPLLEVSGTAIRAAVARGEAVRDQVPEPVYQYIVRHGLYQAGKPA